MSVRNILERINWNRTLSACLAIFYLIFGQITGGSPLSLKMFLVLILPMACIWFGDAIGSITGPMTSLFSGGAAITKESPGCAVVLVGWILLLIPLVLLIIDWISKSP